MRAITFHIAPPNNIFLDVSGSEYFDLEHCVAICLYQAMIGYILQMFKCF